VTLPFGDESKSSNTDNHEFYARPQPDHRGDVHPGEERRISPLPSRCASLWNFYFVKLTKSVESSDSLHRETASAGLSDTVVRQEMPLKPEIFHGRDDFVEDIAQLLLDEETSRICILGPGGMGKTSVSLAVVELPLIQERFPGKNCVWVPCIEATSATLLLEILYIQLQVPEDGDKQVTLEKIISGLNVSKQPCLILLDNFETPWNAPGGTQKQVGDILRRLAMLSHVAILVTMRGRYPPCDKAINWQSKDIKATDEAACLHIYHDINPGSENDPDVARLLATLGHMPFAVTLVAKLGVEGQSTAKELLDAWSESGPDILSNDPEQSMNRSIGLSVESNLVKRNPDATILLTILSLLPAGTTKENLRWWAPTLKTSMIPSAIATLSQAALLAGNTRENSASRVLFVVPVVQSFMQQRDRIAEEVRKQIHSSCCEFVLAHACRFDDLTFPKNSKALAAEDTNIQSILFSPPTSQYTVPFDRTMETLIAFGWHRCDTKPNLEIANNVVAAAKGSGIERYIASAEWCLGKTYNRIGDFHASYDHLQEAYQLFNALPPGEVELQRLSGRCAIDLVDTARMALSANRRGELISLARDVEMKCAALSDDVVHGRSLVLLGVVLRRAGQPHEALRYLDQARTMLKAVGNIPNLAAACQIISWVHYNEGRLLEALDATEEARKYAELTDSPFTQATVSLTFGAVLFSANKDAEAWKQIEIALMKASYTGDRFYIARALEYMGYGYLRRGDYQNAYGAYEAAAEKYLGTVHADRAGGRCEDNMARIKRKQGNPDIVVGFHRPGLDVDKTLFYLPVQPSVSDALISGS
jgi:tetratricopeptide (TPR) repeat protein